MLIEKNESAVTASFIVAENVAHFPKPFTDEEFLRVHARCSKAHDSQPSIPLKKSAFS